MPSSFCLSALCFVCVVVANLKVVAGFLSVPAATARDVFKLREHPIQVRLATAWQYATTRATAVVANVTRPLPGLGLRRADGVSLLKLDQFLLVRR